MTLINRALARRTFLRGVGTTLALPFLDAMVPALSSAGAATRPIPRLGFFYVPNGMYMPNFRPTGEGTGFELSTILSPLAAWKDQIVVVSGLANLEADARDVGAAPHTRCNAAWLNGCRPKRTEGSDIEAGTTVDQFAAREIGKETQLSSLELALEPNYMVGNCEG